MDAKDRLLAKHVKEINKLEKESDELATKCGEFEQQVHDIYAQAQEYKKLWKEQRRKAEALELECERLQKYVRHLEDCEFEGAYRLTPHGGELAEIITPCTCGLLEQD
jgi:peptidoglycan hydrolase CwlO-like protein